MSARTIASTVSPAARAAVSVMTARLWSRVTHDRGRLMIELHRAPPPARYSAGQSTTLVNDDGDRERDDVATPAPETRR
jgi:hypothetical protein